MQTPQLRHCHTSAQKPVHAARLAVPDASIRCNRGLLLRTRAFDAGLDPAAVQTGTYWALGAAGKNRISLHHSHKMDAFYQDWCH